jgi:hypothetical protein
MVGLEYNVVFDDGGIPRLLRTHFSFLLKKDLLQALNAIMQEPPPEPFQKSDISWLFHGTSGHGL